jgi:hypothetical protein
MKYLTLIILSGLLCMTAAAQDVSANRAKVIAMIMDQTNIKANKLHYNKATFAPAAEQVQQGFRSTAPIPKYCLAKGAVICRLEEYVQLHSPFKLNIGVGGE